jgi:hypothetical protein
MSVQAAILKNLLSGGYKDIHGNEVKNSEWRNQRKILKPNETERKQVLIKSLSDILWQAGDSQSACVVQLSNRNCFEIASQHTLNQNDINKHRKSTYCGDGVTERVFFLDFNFFNQFFISNFNSFFQAYNLSIQ